MNKLLLGAILVVCITFSVQSQTNEKAYENEVEPANELIRERNYEQALVHYKKSFTLGNENLIDYYNAACCAAMTGKKDEGFKYLIKSISLGYLDKTWASEDSDLVSLRTDKRWTSVTAEFAKQEKNIAKMFTKIKGMDPTHLIPFRKNGSWGYVDKNTLKVVVNPVFNELEFMGSCTELYYKDQCKIRVSREGEVMEIIYPSRDDEFWPVMGVMAEDDMGPRPVSGFKGFRMNSKNEITEFSSEYERYQPSFFNISGPFTINGKYYAVAHRKDRSGVIDQGGDPLPGFDFVHYELVRNASAKDERLWFYFKQEESGKGGFISELGETRLAGELIGYPFYSNDLFGLSVQFNENSWGILDKEKMEWVIKPQSLHIRHIDYSYKGDCKTEKRSENAAAIYFLVQDGNDEYYIDKDMKAYRPK